ncbi:hypothetical protein HSBAA_41790 [Vreelandella sulfidaeris]|uniref:MmgE/PrpD C-terminal domain-containing protein n=1 Tax=Vreelandella sulfidaeris TaxID=115553 RepID=A0A455UC57_9GAMM|nr:hypothetical protein HSBAA_41790 [Halomonas sulfidaeris]
MFAIYDRGPPYFGTLTADHYEDSFHAAHPMIDVLRNKMVVEEDAQYSAAYHDPGMRSIANAVQVFSMMAAQLIKSS